MKIKNMITPFLQGTLVLKKLGPIFTQKIKNFIWPILKLSSYSCYLNYKKLDPILA